MIRATDVSGERAMVEAMGRGDEAAFDRFFREFAPRIYRFVLHRVGRDVQVAEDLTQEVLSRAMAGIARWRGDAGLYTWLCQMARNEVIDHWRRSRRRERIEFVADDADQLEERMAAIEGDLCDRPDRQLSREQMLQQVREALDALPESHASALEWKYIEGCSVIEIGERLGLNPVATQSLLARARTGLRSVLEAASLSLDELVPDPGDER
jgi:RNA polymerase sigma-70 factor, ECF subfamily